MQNSKNTKYSGVTEKFNMEVMTNYNNHIFEVALNYFKNVKKCIDFLSWNWNSSPYIQAKV